MASEQELLSLDSAAQIAKVHRTTLFRAIRKGELQSSKVQLHGGKPQYYLDPETLQQWKLQREQVATVHEPESKVQPLQDSSAAALQSLAGSFEKAIQGLNLALQDAQIARAHCARTQEENRLLERRLVALQMELNTYQRALTETAESVQELRTREVELQARLVQQQVIEVAPALEDLKTGRPQRKSWGQRVFGWLGRSTQAQ